MRHVISTEFDFMLPAHKLGALHTPTQLPATPFFHHSNFSLENTSPLPTPSHTTFFPFCLMEEGDSHPRAAVVVVTASSAGSDIHTPIAGEECAIFVAGEENLARAFAGEENLARAFPGEENLARAFAGEENLARAFAGEENLARAFAGEEFARSVNGEENLAGAFAGEECHRSVAGEKGARSIPAEESARSVAGEEGARSVAGEEGARSAARKECAISAAGEDCARFAAGEERARFALGDDEVKETAGTLSGESRSERRLSHTVALAGEEDRSGCSSCIEPKISTTYTRSRNFAVGGDGGGGGGCCTWRMPAGEGAGNIIAGREEETEEDGIYCIDHPYKRNPGGICAFCLQEKLGRLLLSSSSKFNASFPVFVAAATATATVAPSYTSPSLSTVRSLSDAGSSNGGSSSRDGSDKRIRRTPSILRNNSRLQRSRSSAVSTQRFLMKGSFWSFLHISRHSPAINTEKNDLLTTVAAAAPPPAREVRRSRSVGCGSRSFSGDIFEKISTGLGDCALRKVESQRDGGRRGAAAETAAIGERVRCSGRIFSSLSSSSSSSLSSVWIAPPYAADGRRKKSRSAAVHGGGGRSWVWALASPIRVLSRSSRTAGSTGKSEPDLTAVPSLLTAP